MQPASPTPLTDAERAALPIIGSDELALLKRRGLHIVAASDIAAIQAAYLRIVEQSQQMLLSLSSTASPATTAPTPDAIPALTTDG